MAEMWGEEGGCWLNCEEHGSSPTGVIGPPWVPLISPEVPYVPPVLPFIPRATRARGPRSHTSSMCPIVASAWRRSLSCALASCWSFLSLAATAALWP